LNIKFRQVTDRAHMFLHNGDTP